MPLFDNLLSFNSGTLEISLKDGCHPVTSVWVVTEEDMRFSVSHKNDTPLKILNAVEKDILCMHRQSSTLFVHFTKPLKITKERKPVKCMELVYTADVVKPEPEDE